MLPIWAAALLSVGGIVIGAVLTDQLNARREADRQNAEDSRRRELAAMDEGEFRGAVMARLDALERNRRADAEAWRTHGLKHELREESQRRRNPR